MHILALFACAPYPEGLLATPAGDGPVVRVDWDAKPLADIPFPNDLATRVDPTSPTGLRLNISTEAATKWESETRVKLNTLSGFGVYAPLSVGFSEPLDVAEIARLHRDDTKLGDAQFSDDAFFVINVDPDSPDYLKPVELDVGHGRYPMDAARTDRYFANDTRSTEPSLVFDTINEDIDGDGVMDWGEDTDNDGFLDVPNVFPSDGDPRADLLTFYEYQSNTLIFRPVVPLREETTYAVVLTNRLIGEDGEPVRSPWAYVNHTRQTEALRPIEDALPNLGLSIEDVSFAWTFTTGEVTGELVEVRRGLYGEGPFKSLANEYPAGVTEAEQLHSISGNSQTWVLPAEIVINTLVDLGLFDGEGAEVVSTNYTAFAAALVGGAFTTPYFLADRDDGGTWDADEWWQMDTMSGSYEAEGQRVVFTCVIPKENSLTQQPYPVAMFGHGYGSSRFDFLTVGWALARLGWAACANDFPGHGPTVDPDQEVLIESYLGATGLLEFYTHLVDSRYRDLNNDGVSDSGGDQWTADAFHTRDMVRQAAVDWMQMVRSFKACGSGTMTLPDGNTATSCDWDGDGTPDIGGEDNRYAIIGGSLGGINAAVAAAVMPEVESFVPIVPGGGLLDVAIRTEISGAVEAMAGRLMTPLFLGYANEDGTLRVTQLVNSVVDMVELPIGTLPSIPSGGRVEIENLANGEIREGYIPSDGTFRLAIPADALDAFEKRAVSGMPETGPEPGLTYEVADNDGLGDPIVLRFYDRSDSLVGELSSWETDVVHEGVTMRAGSPLVAASEGAGRIRANPEFRRVAMVFAAILEPGDPIAYAPHYIQDPYEELGGEPVNILLMPTPGDTIVSVNTGVALARATGLIDRAEVDARYGMTVDQYLIEQGVVSGLEQYGPWTDVNGASCLFDADDLDNGLDGTGAPSGEPVRATLQTDRGVVALRMPYISTTGTHGFSLPEPSAPYDISMFAINQAVRYVDTAGTELSDDPCMEDNSCTWIPAVEE